MKKAIVTLVLLALAITTWAAKPVVTLNTSLGQIELELWPDIAPKAVANFIGLANGTKPWTDPKTGQEVQRPFYDGLVFHRVVKDFVIQAGCPVGDGTGGPGYTFEDECWDPGRTVTGKFVNESEAMTVYMEVVIPFIEKQQTNNQPVPDSLAAVLDACQQSSSLQPLQNHPAEFYYRQCQAKPYTTTKTLRAELKYGSLGMANSGPNTNGSQFFIVTNPNGSDWLNGSYTVFGKVIKGLDVVKKIEALPVDSNSRPNTPPVINRVSIKR